MGRDTSGKLRPLFLKCTAPHSVRQRTKADLMKRTKLQNSIIHARRKVRGISDEYYKTLVFNISNGRTETSADLSVEEADRLISALGGVPPAHSRRTQQRRNKAAGVIALITPAQTQTLNALAEARWGTDYAKPLSALCQRMHRRNAPHTSKQAQSLIEAIKSMQARDQKTAA